jgi:Flp pilus assembly pilin Flp
MTGQTESDHALFVGAKRLVADEQATTVIEYAVIAAGVGAVIAGSVWSLGGEVRTTLYDRLALLF